MSKFLNSALKWVYNKFQSNTSKMLIYTGAAGWAISSAAQMCAILVNPKISNEQKSFLLPQELADAAVNIGAFCLITLSAKKLATKLFTTGKLAPKSVRAYMDRNKELFSNKVGKLDLNLDGYLKKDDFPKAEYETYKSFGSTIATVGAGIVASNIVTPILRNRMASNVHKSYLNTPGSPQTYKTSGMKI